MSEPFDDEDIDPEDLVLDEEAELPLRSQGSGNSRDEQARRKQLLPYVIHDYIENDLKVDDIVEKYDIPRSTIMEILKKAGVSKKGQRKVKSTVLKEVRKVEAEGHVEIA